MWICKNCQENNEDSFDICWKCNYGANGMKIEIPLTPYEKKKQQSKKNREQYISYISKHEKIKEEKKVKEKTIRAESFFEKNFSLILKSLTLFLLTLFILSVMLYFIIGSELFGSIAYLVVAVVISLLHLIVLMYIVMLIYHTLVTVITTIKGKGYLARVKESFTLNFFNIIYKKVFIITTLFFMISSAFIYIDQRVTWITDKTKHNKAKEYFVVGQTLNLYRQALSKVFFPDSVVLKPLDIVQKAIYNQGVKHLPVEDAENSLWYGEWFVKSYSKRMYIPNSSSKLHYDPTTKRSRILNELYSHLIKLSTKDINDPLMYKMYMLAYPNLINYYAYYQTRSRLNMNAELRLTVRKDDMKIRERNKELFKGIMRYQKEWKEYPSKDKNPLYEVSMYTAMLEITKILIMSQLKNENMFSCKEPFIKTYSQSRNRLFGMKGEGLISKIDSHHSDNIKFMWGGGSIETQYIVEQICGYPTSTYIVAMFAKERSYATDLSTNSQYFYTMMRLYELSNENSKAVKSLKKYIGVLKRSEAYRKEFEAIDKKLRNKGES